jgi:hypothetical protein
MKRMKLIGLMLLAVFALGAFAAASASAEEGFLPFQALGNILGGESKLATEKGKESEAITCKKLDESHINFSSDKHGTAVVHWLECTTAGGLVGVNSLGAKAKEILIEVLFLVCLDPKTAAGTLVDSFGMEAAIVGTAHLELPSVGTLIELKGAALGAVLTTGPAKLWVVEFLGKEGKPTVTDCLEGANIKLGNLLLSKNHGAFEGASESIESVLIQFPNEVTLED